MQYHLHPLISDAIIDTNIEGVKEFGTAITCVPTTEAVLYSEDMINSDKIVESVHQILSSTLNSASSVNLTEISYKLGFSKSYINYVLYLC